MIEQIPGTEADNKQTGSKVKIAINYRYYIAIGILVITLGLSLLFYFDSYIRLWISIKYLFESIRILFSFKEQAPIKPDVITTTDLKQFVYWIKTIATAMFNLDIFLGYAIDVILILTRLIKYLAYIPTLIIFFKLFKSLILIEKDEDKQGDTKALIKYKKIEQKHLKPIKNWLNDFFVFWKENRIFNILFIILFLVSYRGASVIIEAVGWYMQFLKTFSLESILNVTAVWFYDLFIVMYKLYKLPLLIVAIYLFFIIRKNRGRATLNRMQAYNENFAEELPIATMITGPIGSGKTQMMASMIFDTEKEMRNNALEIIQKYALMFPRFPWSNFEKYITEKTTSTDENKQPELVNRAQISNHINSLFNDYLESCIDEDDNLDFERGDASLLFNYGPNEGSLIFFDGIKHVLIKEALDAYAQAWFLYSWPLPLAFANLSLRFHYNRFGYFPIYDYDYIEENKRDQLDNWYDYMVAVVNMDSRRITNRKEDNVNEWFHMDGGVEGYTEIDKERGNQFDTRGLKAASEEANQLNDGFNRSIKLTRHEFTIDGTPFTKMYFDTQRIPSVNADLIQTCEDHIHILENSKLDIVLPFFTIDYAICNPFINFYKNYIYQFRSLRKDNTLYNYLLSKIVTIFNNHYQRLLNEFSFKKLNIRKEAGATEKDRGTLYRQSYYIITQKMYADRYRTDCYASFFNEQRLNVQKGYYEAKRFDTSLATPDELEQMNSYWVEHLNELKNYVGRRKNQSSKKEDESFYMEDYDQ